MSRYYNLDEHQAVTETVNGQLQGRRGFLIKSAFLLAVLGLLMASTVKGAAKPIPKPQGTQPSQQGGPGQSQKDKPEPPQKDKPKLQKAGKPELQKAGKPTAKPEKPMQAIPTPKPQIPSKPEKPMQAIPTTKRQTPPKP